MSNPINQLPSNESYTIMQANSNYFCLPMGHTPLEIKCNEVVVKKENKGDERSKQFISNYTAAMEA